MTNPFQRVRSGVLAAVAIALAAAAAPIAPAHAIDLDLGHLSIPADRIQDFYPFDETVYWQARGWPEYDATCTSAPCASGKLPMPASWGCSPANPAANGQTDGDEIDCAVDKAPANSVVYLPRGTYEMASASEGSNSITINASNRVLRCEDPNTTKLAVRSTNTDGGCSWSDGQFYSNACGSLAISVAARNLYSDRARVNWTGGYGLGSRTVTVSDASQFAAGDWIMLHMEGAQVATCELMDSAPSGADRSFEHYSNIMNHTAKVIAKSGNTLTIDRPLRMNYNVNSCGRKSAERYRPIENVGVEGCGFESTPEVNRGSLGKRNALSMIGVANSWAVGNRFKRFSQRAALISLSSRNWFQGNIIEDVQGVTYDTETLALNVGAHDNVVENNVWYEVTVASKQEAGEQGNITAYNYLRQHSAQPRERSFFHHGRYLRADLWEGNDADTEMVSADRWWGRHGPSVVLFRNRLVGNDKFASITVNRDKSGPWPTAEDMIWLGNHAAFYYYSPNCGNNFPECLQPAHNIDQDVVRMHLEKNLYRNPYGLQMAANPPNVDCGTGLGDCPGENPGPTPLRGTNLQSNKRPLSWAADVIPHSFYRGATPPTWWCQEACTWGTVHAGPGAWGDDFGGALCKLPAQILWEGGTCTPMGDNPIPPPPPPPSEPPPPSGANLPVPDHLPPQ